MKHMLVLQEASMLEKIWCEIFYKQDCGGPPCMQMPEIVVEAVRCAKELEIHWDRMKFH